MEERYLRKLLKKFSGEHVNILLLLQGIQDNYGYVPEDAVMWFSEKLDIPASKFFGVMTFYPKFRLKPSGKRTITVCCGAACHIKGSEDIYEGVRNTLGIEEGEDTAKDLSFTIQKATCIGACSIAPVAIIDDKVYGNVDNESVTKLLKGFEKEEEFIGY